MQKTMEFIVAHQAKFAADIGKLFEADKELRESQATLTAALLRVTEIVEDLAESQKATEEQLRATGQQLRTTDRQLRATDERLRATDERLDVLIRVVEKHIIGANGRKKRRK